MKPEKINIVAPKSTQTKTEHTPKTEKLGRTISRPAGVKKGK